MSLRKSVTATAVTAVVIIAMAFLPFVIGALQDRFIQTDYGYGEVSAMELQMDSSSIWQRITLLSAGYDSFEISPDQASISRDKLPDYIEQGLRPYIDRGILPFTPDYATDINEVQCHMLYDQKTAQATGCIYWLVVLRNRDTGDLLELLLDDHSGKLIFLSYSTTDYYGSAEHPPYDLLHLFLYTYLEGIEDESWQREVLEATPNGSLIHTAVVLRDPNSSAVLTLSFLTDTHGLNMAVSADSYGAEYNKAYSKN